MTADNHPMIVISGDPTLTGTPLAASGYPTDSTPADAPRAADGRLQSWHDGVAFAADADGYDPHARTEASAWKRMIDAAKRYASERTGGAPYSGRDLVYVVTIMRDAARK
jgi:hypothetical protein